MFVVTEWWLYKRHKVKMVIRFSEKHKQVGSYANLIDGKACHLIRTHIVSISESISLIKSLESEYNMHLIMINDNYLETYIQKYRWKYLIKATDNQLNLLPQSLISHFLENREEVNKYTPFLKLRWKGFTILQR